MTTAQTEYLRDQFDVNMYPKETAAFSAPPSRDGSNATLPGQVPPALGITPDYYKGPGSKIVTLVANFQDENYFDINFPSYVAGYHSSGINAFVDRNVMSIDSFDWLHRTGANPPHEPSATLCNNKPGQPFKYEGVFAHEYQHLLEFWASPGEATWVNEGLSDYAISVTGYGFPARTIDEFAWDGHIQTFLGWRTVVTPQNLIPQPNGGAENSLTIWEDQGNLETLADYGAAWEFMEFLNQRYGPAFMTDLHNEDVNGLEGLQVVLDKYLTGTTTRQLIHEWAAMVAVDRSIDDGAKLRGATREADYQVSSLHSAVNLDNPQSYSTPGAPPNGSDYVRLRDGAGNALPAAAIRSLEFSGPTHHAAEPLAWTSELQAGDAVLSAGAAADIDRSIVRPIAVPVSGDRSLVFDTKYNIEQDWDFGIVPALVGPALTARVDQLGLAASCPRSTSAKRGLRLSPYWRTPSRCRSSCCSPPPTACCGSPSARCRAPRPTRCSIRAGCCGRETPCSTPPSRARASAARRSAGCWSSGSGWPPRCWSTRPRSPSSHWFSPPPAALPAAHAARQPLRDRLRAGLRTRAGTGSRACCSPARASPSRCSRSSSRSRSSTRRRRWEPTRRATACCSPPGARARGRERDLLRRPAALRRGARAAVDAGRRRRLPRHGGHDGAVGGVRLLRARRRRQRSPVGGRADRAAGGHAAGHAGACDEPAGVDRSAATGIGFLLGGAITALFSPPAAFAAAGAGVVVLVAAGAIALRVAPGARRESPAA